MTQTPSEIWLPVVGWEGLYEVSNRGRVRSLDRIVTRGIAARMQPGRILKPGTTKRGYQLVVLADNGAKSSQHIHHLVLVAFVGLRPDGLECCHNDGDPANNQVGNLRWDTRSANCIDRVRHGRHYLANQTHCKRGHRFTQENTYSQGGNRRGCVACRVARRVSA